MKWTKEQKNAIDSRQGTVLVSAAAGSGKTAVLVERIMERITDAENRCDIDELLIVTFTRAAASQMRERISKELNKRIEADPSDKHLLKQQVLLPHAKICTIDSFSGDLLRENFSLAGISPDFSLVDENENKLLMHQVASEVVEELHGEADESFLSLSEHLISSKNKDTKLVDMMIKLYKIAQSYPFPEKYLLNLVREYDSGEIFKAEIRNYALRALKYSLRLCKIAIDKMLGDEILEAKYLPAFESDGRFLENACDVCENGSWDDLIQAVKFVPKTLGNSKGCTSSVKDEVKVIRSEYKDILTNLTECFCADEKSCDEDIDKTTPIIKALVDAVIRFSDRINQIKNDTNKYDFSDILHLAIKLLTDGENKTQLAKDISKNYVEIMIDEYQDTNKAQDMLFSAISKNEKNLFMVGDVKQSIYRFRQAMPEIFIERRNAMNKYEGKNYPAKIFLDRNFRSRKGVIDGINFIFNQIMSETVGDIEYNEYERLVCAASYDEKNEPDTEIIVIEDIRNDDENATELEGRVIAKKINELVGKMEIADGDGKRLLQYGDICILMRAVSSKGDKLANTLSAFGIPTYSEKSANLFEAHEVKVFMSLLQIIDNPLQDIPLVTVMLSPIFGFTPDELSEMRIGDRKSNVYTLITQSESEKSKAFLEKLRYYRHLAVTMSCEAFIRRLLDETQYAVMVTSMENPDLRLANLRTLQACAKTFDENSENGFSGFVRYLERLENQGDGGPKTEVAEQKNSVRIMTIHKSKGLEFPVCILADCAKGFDNRNLAEKIIVHSRLGVGCVMREPEKLVEYETLSHKAVVLATKSSERSEEMRLLYVALTRAKEKLICTMTIKNSEKKLKSIASTLSEERADPFAVEKASSFANWILMAALRHRDTRKVREKLMIDVSELESESPLSFEIVYPEIREAEREKDKNIPAPNDEIIAKIKEAVLYEYPYVELSEVLAKVSASQLADEYNYRDFFASAKPKFLSGDKLVGAQKGTALHKFMEIADCYRANEDAEAYAKELLEEGLISLEEYQSIDVTKVKKFFDTQLGKRLLQAKKVYKEKRFIINIPIEDLYHDISMASSDELILVQGVMDCAFEEDGKIVLLDYKTDKVKSPDELISRYSEQLRMYKKALEITMGKEVEEVYLYSFSLDQEVKISF